MQIAFLVLVLLGASVAQAGTIKFSGDVSSSTMSSLVAKVRAKHQAGDRDIVVRIGDSDGGDLYAALRARDELRRYDVDTVATGECASACTVLFAAGELRSVDGGRFMFHAPQVDRVTRTGRRMSREEQRSWVEKFAGDWLRAIREVSPALANDLDRRDALTKGGDTWYSGKKARSLGYANN